MTFKGHSRSSEMSRFDRAHMISYYRRETIEDRAVVTMERYLPFHSNYGPIFYRFPQQIFVENGEIPTCISQHLGLTRALPHAVSEACGGRSSRYKILLTQPNKQTKNKCNVCLFVRLSQQNLVSTTALQLLEMQT